MAPTSARGRYRTRSRSERLPRAPVEPHKRSDHVNDIDIHRIQRFHASCRGIWNLSIERQPGFEVTSRAIATGYTLLDSAFNYENEGAVGRAVRFSSAPRSDIIVTSKLPGRHHDYDEALTTIEESAFRMGLDYLDLYLIHWPNPRQDRYVEA